MERGPILAMFAHPDDESFLCAATMARYREQGVPVTVVSATRGEVGQIHEGVEATPEMLPELRAQELRDAMAILGVSDVRFLGFRDSGMQGTDDNHHPEALINAPADAVVEAIVRVIRDVRPAAVITWDESGGYGHPDHIAVHHHTTTAFHAAGDGARFPDAGEPWRPSTLFYTAIPGEEWMNMMQELRDLGIFETEEIDEAGEQALAELPRVEPNCIIDVMAYLDRKVEAMLAHRTQMSDIEPFLKLPIESQRRYLGTEYFHRASPEAPEGVMLRDLFE